MEKAVLVMDMPTKCDECRFHYETYDDNDYYVDKCELLNDMTIDGYTGKYDGCPLKSMNQIVERLEVLKNEYSEEEKKARSSKCPSTANTYCLRAITIDVAIEIVKEELY